jgi:hypothetical protein
MLMLYDLPDMLSYHAQVVAVYGVLAAKNGACAASVGKALPSVFPATRKGVPQPVATRWYILIFYARTYQVAVILLHGQLRVLMHPAEKSRSLAPGGGGKGKYMEHFISHPPLPLPLPLSPLSIPWARINTAMAVNKILFTNPMIFCRK